MSSRRVFLLVLDSCGVGEAPDAAKYGDTGSNTLRSCCTSPKLEIPTLRRLGIFNIDGVGCKTPAAQPQGCFCRMAEASRGKDTTIGHWEIAGLISQKPMPTYPQGFPPGVIAALSRRTGREILCNRPCSGTAVIEEYGARQMETGALIVYTSADSVMQIAAHEEVIPVPELYRICAIAREIMNGEHGVGRIIARPYVGTPGHFTRTANRHDFSIAPPRDTMLDVLSAAGRDVIAVGKINDIFAGRGPTEFVRTVSNADGMERTFAAAARDFSGLCFVNLVDFDMKYGHRNDVDGYAAALTAFDGQLARLLPLLRAEDLLLITADHGCDPATPSTDHSREYVPLLACGPLLAQGKNLGTRKTFADIAATVLEFLGVSGDIQGESLLPQIWKGQML